MLRCQMPHRVMRDKVLLIGPDNQYRDPRGIGTDPAVAPRVPPGVKNSTSPTAAIDHLGSRGRIVFTDAS